MFARFWSLLAALAILAAGCGKKPAAPPQPQIAFVAGAGGFGDHGFNDAARSALETCAKQTGVAVASSAPAGGADIEPQLVLYATEKYDTVIGIGYGEAPALATVARRFEGTHFALIDALVDLPNVESITFDERQGAFLAGALAAYVSKAHHVAFIGGADVPLLRRSETGFVAGARYADPHIRTSVRYLSSFTDPVPAANAAQRVLREGADIVFVVAGPAGLAAIAAVARHPHAYAIGVDTDQDALAPGKILTSVVKHVDTAVLRACVESAGGKPESGHRVLGLADDGIGLTNFAYTRAAIGDSVIARVEHLRDAIIAGRVRVTAAPQP